MRFDTLAKRIAKSYKGRKWKKKKYKTREELGRAIAGKVFWQKFGRRKGIEIIKRAKKRARR